jgi:hypothetical protein
VELSVPEDELGPSSGSCEDQGGTFLVDSEGGDAGCDWLSTNLDRYNYLCQFLDVAVTYPNTCDTCEYFQGRSGLESRATEIEQASGGYLARSTAVALALMTIPLFLI